MTDLELRRWEVTALITAFKSIEIANVGIKESIKAEPLHLDKANKLCDMINEIVMRSILVVEGM